jgi:hypothetical protein
LDVLRARTGKTNAQVTYEEFAAPTHVNLFEQEEFGVSAEPRVEVETDCYTHIWHQKKHNEDKNKDAEKEKRAETEKFEKKIGLLRYLVDDELDLKGSLPLTFESGQLSSF